MSKKETDANILRGHEIKRLTDLATIAYENCHNKKLRMKARESWHQRYTNHVLALNVLLKDSQIKEYEARMRIIEDHEKQKSVT